MTSTVAIAADVIAVRILARLTMPFSSHRVFAIGSAAVVLGLALASVAAAQGGTLHNATRLGGSTAFYTPPLKTAASLKQMAAKKGVAEDIRTVLRESGIPETADAVLATCG